MQFSDPGADFFGNGGMPYMGNVQMGGRPVNRRRRGCLGCLTPLVIIIIVFVVLDAGFGLSFHWGPTTIPVGASPTLILESVANAHATIYIHAGGDNGQIVIQPVRPLNIPFGLAENYQESSDHQTVIYDLGINTGGLYNITVPARINLKVDTGNTALLVDGITGQMHLETNSGSLTVKNSTIVGPSLLRSNSGIIQATGDHLNGSVVLANNKGDTTFQGTLDPTGNYSFSANDGSITLTLPQNTAAQIGATTINGGTIHSNIPGVKAQSTGNGFTLQASLGSGQRAPLTLSTNSGDITINE
jgi:hypothetical protein